MVKYYNETEFVNRIKTCEKIICIGIGKRFEKLIRLFNYAEISNKIHILADNNPNLIGKTHLVRDKSFIIIPVDSIKDRISENTLVIIACNSYFEIIQQIESLNITIPFDIVCFSHIYAVLNEKKALTKKIPSDLNFENNMVIPKIIHYCWFGKKKIPNIYKKWMESWTKYCPDYKIIEWNEDNYDVTKNKYMYQAYQAKKWGFVPDYARLDIIYNYGGIYLDTDVELIRNLDHLLYQKAFAGFESDENVALGLGFGAQKNHSLILKLLKQYDDLSFINEYGEYNLIASPFYQTKILLENGLKQNGEFQTIDGMNIYPEKMFAPKSLTSRLINCTDYSCSIHHYDASWQTDSFRNQNNVFENDMNNHYAWLLQKDTDK